MNDSPMSTASVPLLRELRDQHSATDGHCLITQKLSLLCHHVFAQVLQLENLSPPFHLEHSILTFKVWLHITLRTWPSVFCAHGTHRVLSVLPPLTCGIYMFISAANLTAPSDVVHVSYLFSVLAWVKCFPCITSFKSLNNSESYMPSLSPFSKWGNQDVERLSNFQ